MPETKPLTARQALFVEYYATLRHGTRAAIAAGYSENNAAAEASRLRNHPDYAHVQAALEARLADISAGLRDRRNALIDRLWQIAHFDPLSVLDADGNLLPQEAIPPEDRLCIGDYSKQEYDNGEQSGTTTRMKPVSPVPALKMLVKMAGLDRDQLDLCESKTEEEVDKELLARFAELDKEAAAAPGPPPDSSKLSGPPSTDPLEQTPDLPPPPAPWIPPEDSWEDSDFEDPLDEFDPPIAPPPAGPSPFKLTPTP